MAIPFKAPEPAYNIKTTREKSALTRHFNKRGVPKSKKNRLLLATWNIANLGVQKRGPEAIALVAHILKRFDLIAVQEVNAKFGAFLEVMAELGSAYDFVMSDTAGNEERLAFVYRKREVKPRQLFGEVALRKREYPKRDVTVHYREKKKEKKKTYKKVQFQPFDRNPFIGSFKAGKLDLTLANVHLYFGSFQDSKKTEDHLKYCRRVLEIFALARWASRCEDPDKTYDTDILLLGDMNIPYMKPTESTYKALVKFGMKPVAYMSKTGGTNLIGDKTYD